MRTAGIGQHGLVRAPTARADAHEPGEHHVSERTEQGGPSDQGWSSAGDDTVSLTKGGAAADEQTQASPTDTTGAAAAPLAAGGAHGGGHGPARQERSPSAQTSYGPAPDQQVGATSGYGRPWPVGWPPPTSTEAIIAPCTVFGVPVLGIAG